MCYITNSKTISSIIFKKEYKKAFQQKLFSGNRISCKLVIFDNTGYYPI